MPPAHPRFGWHTVQVCRHASRTEARLDAITAKVTGCPKSCSWPCTASSSPTLKSNPLSPSLTKWAINLRVHGLVHVSDSLQSVDLLSPPWRCLLPAEAAHLTEAQVVRATSKRTHRQMALDESRLTHTTIAHKQQLELRHVGIRRRNLRLHTQGTRTFSKILSPVPRASLVPRFNHHGTCTLTTRLLPQTLLHAVARCDGRQYSNLARKTASSYWGDPIQMCLESR